MLPSCTRRTKKLLLRGARFRWLQRPCRPSPRVTAAPRDRSVDIDEAIVPSPDERRNKSRGRSCPVRDVGRSAFWDTDSGGKASPSSRFRTVLVKLEELSASTASLRLARRGRVQAPACRRVCSRRQMVFAVGISVTQLVVLLHEATPAESLAGLGIRWRPLSRVGTAGSPSAVIAPTNETANLTANRPASLSSLFFGLLPFFILLPSHRCAVIRRRHRLPARGSSLGYG